MSGQAPAALAVPAGAAAVTNPTHHTDGQPSRTGHPQYTPEPVKDLCWPALASHWGDDISALIAEVSVAVDVPEARTGPVTGVRTGA